MAWFWSLVIEFLWNKTAFILSTEWRMSCIDLVNKRHKVSKVQESGA